MTERVPVLVIGGFLGSGKTTLVDRLLRRAVADGQRLAVVSNEFGDTGIDQALLDAGDGGFVELDGGCVCCRLSDALPETVIALLERARPDRLVIECSGLALPADVLVQFWRAPLSRHTSELLAVVVVDAERAGVEERASLDETFVTQLTDTDLVLLNKVDLADRGTLERARVLVAELTGGRPVLECVRCDVDPDVLFPPEPGHLRHRHHEDGDHPHDHDHELHHHYTTEELWFPEVVEDADVIAQVEGLGALRAKGFVRTPAGPRVVQGVGSRVEVTPPTRPVPDALLGRLVVIRRRS